MVRAEAMHANERSEQKVISLIERERADRVADANGGVDVSARLDALDAQLEELREGLRMCLSNQKALADAITDLFAPTNDSPAAPPVPAADPVPVAKPGQVPTEAPTAGAFPPPLTAEDDPADGPIQALSLD